MCRSFLCLSLLGLIGGSAVHGETGIGQRQPEVPASHHLRGMGFCGDWNIRDVRYVEDARKAGCNTIMVDYPGTYWDCADIQEFRNLREPIRKLIKACDEQGMTLWIALMNWNDPLATRLSPADLQGEVEWIRDVCKEEGFNDVILEPALEWPNAKIGGHESRALDLHARCEAVWPYKLAWNRDSRPRTKPDNYHYRDWHPQSTSDQGVQGDNQILMTDHGITGRQLGIHLGGVPNVEALRAWIAEREAINAHWILYTHLFIGSDEKRLWEGITQGVTTPYSQSTPSR